MTRLIVLGLIALMVVLAAILALMLYPVFVAMGWLGEH